MLPDENDTIAAIASARGPAARGVIRVAGPDALAVIRGCVDAVTAERLEGVTSPRRIGAARIAFGAAGVSRHVGGALFVWPSKQSYVRQPSVELHLPGSPPLLECVLRTVCEHGARLAQPGEFTLRAVLGGRIDLTQAEAVLGVIDARGEADLKTALRQLAGGLAGPLGAVREDLLSLLADLEAGLDFVDEEDVTFVEQEELLQRLAAAQRRVATAAQQASRRGGADGPPTVVLAGPPNAGKSTLLNALAELAGVDEAALPALVSERAGSTRDAVGRVLRRNGVAFELIDTAGEANVDDDHSATLENAAQREQRRSVQNAAVVLRCRAVNDNSDHGMLTRPAGASQAWLDVITKADLAPRGFAPAALAVSAQQRTGLEVLLDKIAHSVADADGEMVASTANRCREALRETGQALARASELAPAGAEDLVALELRVALAGLGRVLGDAANDEVLDRIFSRFCIGK